MKKTDSKLIQFTLLLFVFSVVVVGAGCQKENLVDNLYPFKLHYAIQNEQGQEVRQIKEGESFSIYFSIENTSNRDAAIYYHHQF